MKWYAPTVVAPPISLSCNDRVFMDTQSALRESPLEALAFYGLPYHLRNHASACLAFQRLLPSIPPIGLAASSPVSQLPHSNMAIPEAKRLIYDSAKLACLDRLLQELKAGDHKVLIYFQMTRMMDLMEEYLIYRQYKYLRLDGSSKLEDRRDMVIDWQTRLVPKRYHTLLHLAHVFLDQISSSLYSVPEPVVWVSTSPLLTQSSFTTTIGIRQTTRKQWTGLIDLDRPDKLPSTVLSQRGQSTSASFNWPVSRKM